MQLILFVDYEGDCECAGTTDVYPVDWETKELAAAELTSLLEDYRSKCKTLEKAREEWQARRPEGAYQFLGGAMAYAAPNNKASAKKLEKKRQEDQDKLIQAQKWQAECPAAVESRIYFAGFEISMHDITHMEILTIDEWFRNPNRMP